MYLLDTDTCVEYLRQANSLVVQRIRAKSPNELRLCSVVLAELYYGAHRSAKPQANLAKVQAFAQPFLSLPFDDKAAEIYGRIRADLAAQGALIGPNDLLIAAIALAHGAVLVTHNVAEFSRVPGLVVEDWQAP
jgi:tRNA(fMet)-specific endonuclease VapC